MADSQDIYTTADMLGRMPSRSPMKDLHGYVADWMRKRDEVPTGALAAALEEGPPKQPEPNWFGNYVLGPMGKVAEAMPGNSFDLATGVLFPGGKVRLPPGKAPIRAYHGSPYDFDRFDAAHIGKGEGAQAYGHGLYFAENPTVAETYKNVHGTATPTIDAVTYMGNELSGLAGVGRATLRPAGVAQRPLDADGLRKFPSGGTGSNIENFGVGATPAKLKEAFPNYSDDQLTALRWLINTNGDGAKAAALLMEKGQAGAAKIAAETANQFSVGDKVARAKMYEVALHATPHQFLDWDKPLSQQSEGVTTGLKSILKDHERMPSEWLQSSPGAEGRLQEAGIPGIRYKDQLSRGAEGGTSNYVVFPGSENIVEILRKYGILAPVAAPTLASVLASPDQQ